MSYRILPYGKKLSFGMFLLFAIQSCSTPQIAQLKETPPDLEKLEDFDTKTKINLKKVGLLVDSHTELALAGEFGSSFKKATSDLVSSLGGVEVVKEKKSWEQQKAEQNRELKKFLKQLQLEQKFGNQESKIKKVETKFSAWYEIHSNLTGATSRVIYHPPREIVVKDKDGNERIEMSQPYWRASVTAYVYFKVVQTNPGQPSEVILLRNIHNSFHKIFLTEPKKAEVIALYPEAILYCYEDIREKLQELFPVKTVLTQMLDGKSVGKIKGGLDLDLTVGRKFELYLKEFMPTLIGEREVYQKVGTLTLFEIGETESWGKISGPLILGLGDTKEVKLGVEAIILPERRTIIDFVWRKIKSTLGIKGNNFLEAKK